ncbi:hypothetical protein QMK17_09000 [Rhodococcus sp. G-MC3]|uniref:hypothetical protein n=1 Tax=Rhodococcus sp. G-MC3 TaxID=3046209 RepID=UPI0024B8BFB0|nr:hypothetical protein [Rhodococcus sp. G-MC3]MDJ0393470.1 hypothetical protein [Rhodococcus sp. G-MC3]
MRLTKMRITVAAVAAVALTGTTVGTAQAEPVPVGYSITSDGLGTVRTILDAGAFRIDANGTSVSIVDNRARR